MQGQQQQQQPPATSYQIAPGFVPQPMAMQMQLQRLAHGVATGVMPHFPQPLQPVVVPVQAPKQASPVVAALQTHRAQQGAAPPVFDARATVMENSFQMVLDENGRLLQEAYDLAMTDPSMRTPAQMQRLAQLTPIVRQRYHALGAMSECIQRPSRIQKDLLRACLPREQLPPYLQAQVYREEFIQARKDYLHSRGMPVPPEPHEQARQLQLQQQRASSPTAAVAAAAASYSTPSGQQQSFAPLQAMPAAALPSLLSAGSSSSSHPQLASVQPPLQAAPQQQQQQQQQQAMTPEQQQAMMVNAAAGAAMQYQYQQQQQQAAPSIEPSDSSLEAPPS